MLICHPERFVDNFKRLCIVRADLSKLEGEPFRGLVDDVYVKRFKIILRFGAETQAQIGWLEDVSATENTCTVRSY